jgi:hypothetical protein
MASKIKVDQIEGSSGSTITIPSGQSFVLTDGLPSSSLPTVPTTKGGTGLTSLGSAGQALKVNGAGNALEFGNAGGLVSTGFNESTTSHNISSSSFTMINGSNFTVAMTAGQKIHLHSKVGGYQNINDKTENISMFATESGGSAVNIRTTATNSGGMGLTRDSYDRYWHSGAEDHGLMSLEGWYTWTAQTTGTHTFDIRIHDDGSGSINTTNTQVWYMITSV